MQKRKNGNGQEPLWVIVGRIALAIIFCVMIMDAIANDFGPRAHVRPAPQVITTQPVYLTGP